MSEFVERRECKAKSGAPTLCKSCGHNRQVIGELEAEIERLWVKLISARLGHVLEGIEAERMRSFLERIECAAGRDAQTGRGAELTRALASSALKRWREETERATALAEKL